MKATIERNEDVEEGFAIGDLVEYSVGACQYLVLVTDQGMEEFQGVVLQASSTSRWFVGETDDRFVSREFTLFKGKLILEN